MIAGLAFYMFALVLIASAAIVVTVRNPVYAVLALILAFFNGAGLFLLLGAEFLAFILLIVYVGAVAVLFLFVVMMLDLREQPVRANLRKFLPAGLSVGGILLAELGALIWTWPGKASAFAQVAASNVENTKALGRVLYTTYMFPFQVSGVILLVAMIGAIVLTLRPRRDVKRQDVWVQLDRQRKDVVELRKVKSGEGAL